MNQSNRVLEMLPTDWSIKLSDLRPTPRPPSRPQSPHISDNILSPHISANFQSANTLEFQRKCVQHNLLYNPLHNLHSLKQPTLKTPIKPIKNVNQTLHHLPNPPNHHIPLLPNLPKPLPIPRHPQQNPLPPPLPLLPISKSISNLRRRRRPRTGFLRLCRSRHVIRCCCRYDFRESVCGAG